MAPTTPKPKTKGKAKNAKETNVVTDEDREPGVIYIGHIPHGFYEPQMKKYFSQFGKVLQVKLSRSKKNGKSKGYAFVKFQYAAVAKTVADTCHNYLFFDKLLKCEYKKPEEVHEDTFFQYKWKQNNKPKRLHNAPKTDEKMKQLAKRTSKRQTSKLKKLQELGLDLNLDDIVTQPEVKPTSKEDSPKKDVPGKTESQKKDVPSKAEPQKKGVTSKAKPQKKGVTSKAEPQKKGVTSKAEPQKKDITSKAEPQKKVVPQETQETTATDDSATPVGESRTLKRKRSTKDSNLGSGQKKTPIKSTTEKVQSKKVIGATQKKAKRKK